ncbi:nicotinamide N-methyltransferase-like [Anguilla anguilla]|uniref:nicotinamide N-methyltransferase-like n=1 Tax=Anguilla anguilla TaxID=7936 RepID=UPI0015B1C0C3|nr:nicotinamide N-methyltransferase-like [Anguilla anguilla]
MDDSDHVTFTESEFYQRHFDSREYFKAYYRGPNSGEEFFPFLLQQLNETFSSGNIKGKKLIDIGCGPTIHGLISASKCFEEIVVSDFTDSNRREIEKWLRNEEGCFDWRPTIEFVCELEGGSRSPEEVEQRLRQIVKQVRRCDVRQENPFHPLTMEPADCILSSFCLEAACKDLETYRRALGSTVALLKPGGVLVLISALNASFYFVGQEKFSCLFLSESFIKETLRNLGFSVKQANSVHTKETNKGFYDAEAVFYLVAQKTK